MRHRLLLISIVLVLVCALAGVGLALSQANALTTALGYALVRAHAEQGACVGYTISAGSYTPYRIHPLPDGFIIFYTAECGAPGQPRLSVVGQQVYRWRGLLLEAGERGYSIAGPPPAGALVTFAVDVELNRPYTYVEGQVVTTTVAAVEVTFANGTVQRETPTGGYFAALVTEGVMACRLDLLDAQGQLVQQYDLALPPPIPLSFGACGP